MSKRTGWGCEFDDPIELPDGRTLVTLQDAGTYITKLPKAEHEAPEWQAAMEALILVATLGGPTMFARIGVMRALNRNVERVFDPSRKDTHWGQNKPEPNAEGCFAYADGVIPRGAGAPGAPALLDYSGPGLHVPQRLAIERVGFRLLEFLDVLGRQIVRLLVAGQTAGRFG